MKYLFKYATCIVVKGVLRSTISDLQREKYYFISNDMADMLYRFEKKDIQDIFDYYGKENKEIVNEYMSFLIDNEFVFFSEKDEVDLFPDFDLYWNWPSVITNCLVDIDKNFAGDLKALVAQMNSLNCQYIQFRSYSTKSIHFWKRILSSFDRSRIQGIEICSKWESEIDNDSYLEFNQFNRLKSLVLHSAMEFKVIQQGIGIPIIATTPDIATALSCGNIDWNYFNVNIPLFTEAQKHNTCLNRKISIDVNGDIKNCPSMAKSYGNIKDTTLAEAIEKPGFKDMWFINKDQIAVCKDCEFRYICTDCRAYIENPEDIYSKPLKCGYNPYTAEWEEWSTNPLKQKAIEYYGMQELVKKEK
jgi:SPASM domain peptide maturase of grasp-with-spasm system